MSRIEHLQKGDCADDQMELEEVPGGGTPRDLLRPGDGYRRKAIVRSCAAAKVRCGHMTTSHGES